MNDEWDLTETGKDLLARAEKRAAETGESYVEALRWEASVAEPQTKMSPEDEAASLKNGGVGNHGRYACTADADCALESRHRGAHVSVADRWQ